MDSPALDPRAEALARVDGRFDVRVLEPSPPAVPDPPYFADDPVLDPAPGPSAAGLPVLAPVPVDGGATWDELVRDEPHLAPWCAERWLAAFRRLSAPSDPLALVRTRDAWHALAEHVLAPARHRANGKIGLRYTRGGFGTPFFGAEEQVRLTADGLVVVRGAELTVHPVGTVQAAADVLGIAPGAPTDVYTPTTPCEPDAPLPVDPASARLIGDWFGFGASVLESLRATVPAAGTPARIQLWPEHFDLSFDFGDEGSGRRATFGASPGDEQHAEPYLYVTPWTAPRGSFWNEGSFASHPFSALLTAADQRAEALAFFDRATHELAR